MQVSIYFVLNDYPAILEGGPQKGQMGLNRKGLHYGGSWERKPAAYAFGHLAALIDDRFQTKAVAAALAVPDSGPYGREAFTRLQTCTFVDKQTGSPLVVWWLGVPIRMYRTAGRIRTSTGRRLIDQPVPAGLLDGRVYEVPVSENDAKSLITAEVPVADSLLELCRRKSVSLSLHTMFQNRRRSR